MLTSTKVINDPSNEIDITDNNDDKKHEESENGFHGFVFKA